MVLVAVEIYSTLCHFLNQKPEPGPCCRKEFELCIGTGPSTQVKSLALQLVTTAYVDDVVCKKGSLALGGGMPADPFQIHCHPELHGSGSGQVLQASQNPRNWPGPLPPRAYSVNGPAS